MDIIKIMCRWWWLVQMMMMMMMMMAGQIKLILKTIRCTCTKSQHYDSPNFFLVCPTKMVSWSEISMSVLQRKLFADLQRWLVSCYCVIIAQIKWKKKHSYRHILYSPCIAEVTGLLFRNVKKWNLTRNERKWRKRRMLRKEQKYHER